jgi:hypothetical protein
VNGFDRIQVPYTQHWKQLHAWHLLEALTSTCYHTELPCRACTGELHLYPQAFRYQRKKRLAPTPLFVSAIDVDAV